MKTQNELNEILLEAYEAGYKTGTKEDLIPFRIWYEQNESKILALGKPEPLAKNKQFNKRHEGHKLDVVGNYLYCKTCDVKVKRIR